MKYLIPEHLYEIVDAEFENLLREEEYAQGPRIDYYRYFVFHWKRLKPQEETTKEEK